MKKVILVLNTIFPYLVLSLLILVFGYGRGITFIDSVWENIFSKTIVIPVLLLLVIIAVTYILNIVYMIYALKSHKNMSLTKANMIVKLIQIPAYVLIFIIGVICAVTILMIPISLLLFIIDILSVGMTGMFAAVAFANMRKNGIIEKNEQIKSSVLSFVFCVDVLVAVNAFLKERSSQ